MIKGIVQRIPSRFYPSKSISRLIYLLSYLDGPFSKEADSLAKLYGERDNVQDLKILRKDMVLTWLFNGISMGEYVDYSLFPKNKKDRSEYLTKDELYKIFHFSEKNKFPRDKYKRYLLFKECFHRDIIRISFELDTKEKEEEEYSRFIEKHDKFIVKPVNGVKGQGVAILTKSIAPDINALRANTDGPVLVEELINQADELSVFHPQSVNTLRFVSGINSMGEYHPIFALFRSGKGNSIVDNVGAGGIISLVDIENGEIISDGLSKHVFFSEHPDTRIQFRGYKIPQWDELRDIVETAHKKMMKQELIGWDFAWSIKGWDLVEVNPAPAFASYQTFSGKGVKPYLTEIGLI